MQRQLFASFIIHSLIKPCFVQLGLWPDLCLFYLHQSWVLEYETDSSLSHIWFDQADLFSLQILFYFIDIVKFWLDTLKRRSIDWSIHHYDYDYYYCYYHYYMLYMCVWVCMYLYVFVCMYSNCYYIHVYVTIKIF